MKNKETYAKHSSKLQYTVLVASLVAAFPEIALAQAADDKHVQRVVVTGSNIKRVDQETASPVQLLSHQEIEPSGAQLLDNLTSNDRGAISDLGSGRLKPSRRDDRPRRTAARKNAQQPPHRAAAQQRQWFIN